MSASSKSPPSVPDAETWVGRVIDQRYRITQVLGEGGMGTVFVAEHLRLGTPVALKVVHPHFLDNEEVAARFAREAMASARIDHPHVASALDYGTLSDGLTYLVMPFVAGESLQESIDVGPSPWQRVCHIGAQIADALMAAHAEGIIHRDLKPENVMITPTEDGTGRATVLDFGIARVPTDVEGTPTEAAPDRDLTKVGTVIGTPGYMAPQQATGQAVDSRADLYSLGVVLWEMVAGKPLFLDDSLMAILSEQMGEPLARVSSLGVDPDIPLELDELIARMLAYEPDERPADAREVRDALRALIGRETPLSLEAAASSETTRPDLLALKADVARAGNAATVVTGATHAGASNRVARALTTFFTVPIVLAAALVILRLTTVNASETDAPPRPLRDSIIVEWRALLRGEFDVAPEIRDEIDTLLHTDDPEGRRAAAGRLLERGDAEGVPDYARALAEVVGLNGRGCAPHREKLEAVAELGDDRAVPALRGLLEASDAECIETKLLATIATLEGLGGARPSPDESEEDEAATPAE